MTEVGDDARTAVPAGLQGRWWLLRTAVASALRTVGRRDLSVAAAELTYFAGIAVVPWLLLSTWSLSWGTTAHAAEGRLRGLRDLVPPDMGARGPYDALVHAGTHLGLLGAVATLLPATFYGEGVRRGCLALVPSHDRFTGWRARLAMLPLLVIAVPLARLVLHLGEPAADLARADGAWPFAGRVVLGFATTWIVLTVPLTWVYRHVAPRRVRWPAAFLGALGTASFLAGFLQGFTLFLSIPIDVGVPFGGLDVVGGVVAVGFWLFLLHAVVLVGWVVTATVDERLRPGVAG